MTATTHQVGTSVTAGRAATPRFYGVQMLRGAAALLIVFFHSQLSSVYRPPAALSNVIDHFAFGVDLFFPISGVVMYLTAESLLRRGSSKAWATFAWRRVLRVYPLYWVFTTVKLALVLLVPAATVHSHFAVWHTVASYLLLPARNLYGDVLPLLPVGWTLIYEMFFYLIVTLALLFRASLLPWCTAVIVSLSLLSFAVPASAGAFTFLLNPIELEFLAGMYLAWFATSAWGRARAARVPTAALLVLASVATVAAFLVGTEDSSRREWGLCGALIVGCFLLLEPRLPFARMRSALLLGDISYSLYLSHTFVVPAAAYLARGLVRNVAAYVLCLLVTAGICIAVAIPVHFRLEIPLLKLPGGWRLPWSVEA